jgi:hypothetical protein
MNARCVIRLVGRVFEVGFVDCGFSFVPRCSGFVGRGFNRDIEVSKQERLQPLK